MTAAGVCLWSPDTGAAATAAADEEDAAVGPWKALVGPGRRGRRAAPAEVAGSPAGPLLPGDAEEEEDGDDGEPPRLCGRLLSPPLARADESAVGGLTLLLLLARPPDTPPGCTAGVATDEAPLAEAAASSAAARRPAPLPLSRTGEGEEREEEDGPPAPAVADVIRLRLLCLRDMWPIPAPVPDDEDEDESFSATAATSCAANAGRTVPGG